MSAQTLAKLGRTEEAITRLKEGIAAATRTSNDHAASEMQALLDDLTRRYVGTPNLINPHFWRPNPSTSAKHLYLDMATPLPHHLRRTPHQRIHPARLARSVKDELRENLIAKLRDSATKTEKAPLFPGIVGYEDTVVPQIVNAVLSKHNFILLGLRGQAKSRILRALTTLLDPACPYIAGSEVRDNPYAPISKVQPRPHRQDSATKPPSPGSPPTTASSKN